MKKIIFAVLAAALLLAGCGKAVGENSKANSDSSVKDKTTSSAVSENENVSSKAETTATENSTPQETTTTTATSAQQTTTAAVSKTPTKEDITEAQHDVKIIYQIANTVRDNMVFQDDETIASGTYTKDDGSTFSNKVTDLLLEYNFYFDYTYTLTYDSAQGFVTDAEYTNNETGASASFPVR